jgi:hypothetical protein
MSEMVERVAKSLWAETRPPYLKWDEAFPVILDSYRHQARAAIAAMREPTEEMLVAASREVVSEAKWRAMIDAALNEKEAPPVKEGL